MMDISIHALLAESDNRILFRLLIKNHFYPRSPCGERHLTERRHWQVGQISIHALLAESDLGNVAAGLRTLISIHALLAESDKTLVILPK